MQTNILGTNLEICCTSPMTGYYRDGVCRTSEEDSGTHTVCAPKIVAESTSNLTTRYVDKEILLEYSL